MVSNLPELNWPSALLGPMPRSREIRVVCLTSLVCAGLILIFGLFPARQGGTRLGYEEDFVAFYGIGRLLNEHPPDRLYDFSTQETIYLALRPEQRFLGLPYIHALTLAATGVVLLALVRLWWAFPQARHQTRTLTWAATITWTLVLNAYVPIYDCAVLALVGLLAASALREPETGELPPAFATIVALCFAGAWATQPIAQLVRLQIFTIVLVYSGLYLLRHCQVAPAAPLMPAAVAPLSDAPQGAAIR